MSCSDSDACTGETLLEDLFIPAVTHDILSCGDFGTLECIAFAAAGQPCCIPIACLVDPICTLTSTVIDVAAITLHPGDLYCSRRSREDYLTLLLNGTLNDLTELQTFLATGGLSELFDFDVALMTAAGHEAPRHVRDLIRSLTQAVYDGGAAGPLVRGHGRGQDLGRFNFYAQ